MPFGTRWWARRSSRRHWRGTAVGENTHAERGEIAWFHGRAIRRGAVALLPRKEADHDDRARAGAHAGHRSRSGGARHQLLAAARRSRAPAGRSAADAGRLVAGPL